jgi:AcrR family transcriptional regulator
MSRKAAKPARSLDRRVQRTRDLLGDAIVALMLEKPWPEIKVQHVLDRAGVSRSTFYAHYRDKDDLFLSDVEDFFESMASFLSRAKERSHRVVPVREFCEHLIDVRDFISALHNAGKLHDVWELGRGHFARAIQRRLTELSSNGAGQSSSARSHMLAGALISLLQWWMDRGMKESPLELDHMFHEIVSPGSARAPLPTYKVVRSFAHKVEPKARGKSPSPISRHA